MTSNHYFRGDTVEDAMRKATAQDRSRKNEGISEEQFKVCNRLMLEAGDVQRQMGRLESTLDRIIRRAEDLKSAAQRSGNNSIASGVASLISGMRGAMSGIRLVVGSSSPWGIAANVIAEVTLSGVSGWVAFSEGKNAQKERSEAERLVRDIERFNHQLKIRRLDLERVKSKMRQNGCISGRGLRL